MDDVGVKLKGVITNRCTEDKWSAEVVDCYAAAQKREDLRTCRAKLPPDSAAKLQKEEMDVMVGAGFGGMRPHGMSMGGSGDHPRRAPNDPHVGRWRDRFRCFVRLGYPVPVLDRAAAFGSAAVACVFARRAHGLHA